ncbi:MAG: hypothetical protein R6W83_11950, partial [Cryobacterium sp.]
PTLVCWVAVERLLQSFQLQQLKLNNRLMTTAQEKTPGVFPSRPWRNKDALSTFATAATELVMGLRARRRRL